MRAQLAFVSSRGTDAIPLLLAAARRLEPLDIAVARETYVDAFSAALFGARLNGSVGIPEVAEAARAAPRHTGSRPAEAATADLLLDALVALADDYAAAVPLCREAVQRLSGDEASAKERLRWLWQGCVVALEIWDDEHASSLSRSSVEIARDDGDAQRARARPQRAHARARVLRRPRRRRRDCLRDGVGRAGDGDPRRALRRADRLGVARQAARNDGPHRDDGARGGRSRRGHRTGHQRLRARGPLQRSRPVRGGARGRRVRQRAPRGRRGELGPERAGRGGHALRQDRSRHGRAEPAGHQGSRPREPIGRAASRRVLGRCSRDGADADRWFRTAIDHLRRTRVRAELARTHLLYGEWLRRDGRRLDARAELNIAHELFMSMGMEAFARARRPTNSRATGEKRRRRIAETRDDLTAAGAPDRRARPRRALERPRSAPACSSARAPSSGTCATCTPSSGSGPDANCGTPSSANAIGPRPSKRHPTRLIARPCGSRKLRL